MNYEHLLRDLGSPSFLTDIYSGNAGLPKFFFNAPPNLGYGSPPVIIPLLSSEGGPDYVGLVSNWFGGADRGFVRFYAETGEMEEVALTVQQLKIYLLYELYADSVNPEGTAHFAEHAGLCAAGEVEDYFRVVSGYEDLIKFEAFRSDPPSLLMKSANDGQPEWVLARPKHEIEKLIAQGEYLTAWHAINSPGILYHDDIESLLTQIRPFANDPRFDDLIKCWVDAHA